MNAGQYRAVRSDGDHGTEMSSVNGEYNTSYGASSTDRFQQTRREVRRLYTLIHPLGEDIWWQNFIWHLNWKWPEPSRGQPSAPTYAFR